MKLAKKLEKKTKPIYIANELTVNDYLLHFRTNFKFPIYNLIQTRI